MKTLNVPLLSSLDALDLFSIRFIMEEKAPRDYINVINWPQYPYIPIVAFSIARSKHELYLYFYVWERYTRAEHTIDGSNINEDSCVSIYIKCGNRMYTNFDFNPRGTCCAAHRLSKSDKVYLRPEEYQTIRRHPFTPLKELENTNSIHTWELAVAIPFALLGYNSKTLPASLLANFYKCGEMLPTKHYLSWSPIDLPEPEFNCPEFFGELIL